VQFSNGRKVELSAGLRNSVARKILVAVGQREQRLESGSRCVGELGRWEGGGSGSGGLFDTATEHVREECVGHGTGAFLSGDMLCSIKHLGQIPQLNIVDCLRDRNRRVLCWEEGRKHEAHRVSRSSPFKRLFLDLV